MASDLLPGVYPDSVVALRAESGSAVLCLEIDEATEHGQDIRDKLARYSDALAGRSGWHVVFITPSRARVDFVARVAKRGGGYQGLDGRAPGTRLGELQTAGLACATVPMFPSGRRAALGDILSDPMPRRCPTPVGTDAWLAIFSAMAPPKRPTRR